MVFRHGRKWRQKLGRRGVPMAMAAALRFVEGQWMDREKYKAGF